MKTVFFGGTPEEGTELQDGVDPNREGMGLNLEPLEEPRVNEHDPMWSSEFSNLDWLFEEG
ncbi:MAG: hypothetical protein OEW69_10475 [Nitrospirota bacterium]|nr:hypothetical protein [Nitrospirota bacterium]